MYFQDNLAQNISLQHSEYFASDSQIEELDIVNNIFFLSTLDESYWFEIKMVKNVTFNSNYFSDN